MLKRISALLLVVVAFTLGLLIANLGPQQEQSKRSVNAPPPTNTRRPAGTAQARLAQAPTETIPPFTSLPSLTPSHTLRPPPTFEPATATIPFTNTPTITLTPTLDINVQIPGLQGLQTSTPAGATGECVPRKDWKLEYEVKRDDALIRIADFYNTTVDELVKGNCLKDRNVIVIGQKLKVPGTAHPVVPRYQCIPIKLLTPFDGTLEVPGGGNVAFDWEGPRVPRNLIRIYDLNNNIKHESVIELRTNEAIDIGKALPDAGTYIWYVYPLDENFRQTCPEGGPYRFTKKQAPTATPTSQSGGFGGP